MRFYERGKEGAPVLILIPGTCCHYSMFDEVIPYLEKDLYTVTVSFDGFDENEHGEYPDMKTETEKIEAYIEERFGGSVCGVYGCSLGGSFAAYLVQRGKVRISHVIIGSSDMDELHGIPAKLEAKLMAKIMYPAIRDGHLPGWLAKLSNAKTKRHPEDALYRQKFTDMFFHPFLKGGIVSEQSIYNQFYSDLDTVIGSHIGREGTVIHVFYAEKMGEKYLERYRRHFLEPDIRTFPLRHEELLACRPGQWASEVLGCLSG